jgi:hypothetical protein
VQHVEEQWDERPTLGRAELTLVRLRKPWGTTSYEVLVPEPGKLPTWDATKEPTYRLHKAMKLV